MGKLQEVITTGAVTYCRCRTFVSGLHLPGRFFALDRVPGGLRIQHLRLLRAGGREPDPGHPAGHPHRRGGHAGGDLAAELLLGRGGGGGRVRAGQPGAHRERRAGGRGGIHPDEHHDQGDEPLAGERRLRRVRRGDVGRAGGGGDADGALVCRRRTRPSCWRTRARSSSCRATGWRWRRRSTRCGSWRTCWRARAFASSTPSTPSRGACRGT